MDTTFSRTATYLPKGGLLRFVDAEGQGVAVFSGCLWVTQEGDSADVTLEAGESFVFNRPGLSVVQALAPSSLFVFEPPARPTPQARPTADELHRQARRMRDQAIGEAIGSAVARLLNALQRLGARV